MKFNNPKKYKELVHLGFMADSSDKLDVYQKPEKGYVTPISSGQSIKNEIELDLDPKLIPSDAEILSYGNVPKIDDIREK